MEANEYSDGIKVEKKDHKKVLVIIFTIALVISLLVLGFFVYKYFENSNQITALTNENTETRVQLSVMSSKKDISEKDLAETKNNLEQTKIALSDKEKDILDLDSKISKLTSEKEMLITKYNALMCKNTFSYDEINGYVTNNELISPITKIAEKISGNTYISTTYSLVWSDDKSAIFTLENNKNQTDKVFVSWNHNESIIRSIFVLSGSCYLYLPDKSDLTLSSDNSSS